MTNVIIGVLGAVAVAIAGSVLQWWQRIWRLLVSRTRDNHRALAGGWPLNPTMSSDGRIRVLCAVAPSRGMKDRPVDPDRAVAFVRACFQDEFPEAPAFSLPSSGVRFEKSLGTHDGYLWIWTTGRIDYDGYVEPIEVEGRYFVDISEVVRRATRLARAINTELYQAIFRWPRMHRRRTDWYVGFSESMVKEGITVSWSDLAVTGRMPKRASASQQAYCPMGGYASQQLRSWPIRRPLDEFVRTLLTDVFAQNGYYEAHGAVDDLVASLSRDTSISGTPHLPN